MARTLNKKGLRRDLNFTDIPDKNQALNNLLDGLVLEEGETFTSVDLDAIKNISSTTMTNADFLNIQNSAVRVINDEGALVPFFTTSTDENGDPIELRTTIKLKNRFDIAEFTTGEPQFFGGDGLTARYYESEYIDSEAVDVENIFTTPSDGEVYEEVFWENGFFDFNRKINDNFADRFGGVSWTGFFRPTESGVWRLSYRSSSFFTVEFDDRNGNYVLHARKSQVEYTFSVEAATAGDTTLKLENPAGIINLLTNDILVNDSFNQFTDPLTTGYDQTPVTILSIDSRDEGIIELSEPLDENIPAGTTFTFRFQFGEIEGRNSFTTLNLEEFESYKIRIRFWYPDDEDITSFDDIRTITFWVDNPGIVDETSYFNYKFLQSESYNKNPTIGTVAYGNFLDYYNSRLTSGGGDVGGESEYNDYRSILTLNTINISYEPPTSLSDIFSDSYSNRSVVENDNYIPLNITDQAEVGNYVIASDTSVIPLGTRVKNVMYNTGVFLDTPILLTDTVNIRFADHRGLIGVSEGTWSSGNDTITNVSSSLTDLVEVGDVIVALGSPTYNRVKSKTSNSITTEENFTASSTSGDPFVFVYKSSGAINDSIGEYCTNIYASKTISVSPNGTNTLIVEPNVNIQEGQIVQYGNRIPEGTTVDNIDTVGVDTFDTTASIARSSGSLQIVVENNSNIEDGYEVQTEGSAYPSGVVVTDVIPISTFCTGVTSAITTNSAAAGQNQIEISINTDIVFPNNTYTTTAAISVPYEWDDGSEKMVLDNNASLSVGHAIQSGSIYPADTTITAIQNMTDFCNGVYDLTAFSTISLLETFKYFTVKLPKPNDSIIGSTVEFFDVFPIGTTITNVFDGSATLKKLRTTKLTSKDANLLEFSAQNLSSFANMNDYFVYCEIPNIIPKDAYIFAKVYTASTGGSNDYLGLYLNAALLNDLPVGIELYFRPKSETVTYAIITTSADTSGQIPADAPIIIAPPGTNESKVWCVPEANRTFTTEKIVTTSNKTTATVAEDTVFTLSIPGTATEYVVTLSNNIKTGGLPGNELIVFAPAGTTESKEICFPPEGISYSNQLLIETSAANTSAISKDERVSFTSSGQTSFSEITLSANIQNGDIDADQIVVFAPAGTTESKEICFPQEDVSFPFVATEDGMKTPNSFPDIEINPTTGPGKLKFVGLSANVEAPPETVSGSATYNRTLTIEDATGTPFKILCTTV